MASHCEGSIVLDMVVVDSCTRAVWSDTKVSGTRIEKGKLVVAEVLPLSVQLPRTYISNGCRMPALLLVETRVTLMEMVVFCMTTT
jgi:hypothetical protein